MKLIIFSSGLGYIVGAGAATVGNDWSWSLRVTPILGGIALLLIIFVVIDPPRGACEGGGSDAGVVLVSSSSYASDIWYLLRK